MRKKSIPAIAVAVACIVVLVLMLLSLSGTINWTTQIAGTETYSFGCDAPDYGLLPVQGNCGSREIVFDFGEVKTLVSMEVAWYCQFPSEGGSNHLIQLHISIDGSSWYHTHNIWPPSPTEISFSGHIARYLKFKVPDYYPDLVIHWVHGNVTIEGAAPSPPSIGIEFEHWILPGALAGAGVLVAIIGIFKYAGVIKW